MPELVVKRRKQFFAPANCCYHIYIDDVKEATLSNGETEHFTLESGKHRLRVRNNYFTSRKVNLELNENQKVEVETFSVPILGWLYILAPVVLIIISTLKLFHVVLSGVVFSIGLLPLFLFIVLALLLGVLKKALLVKVIG